MKRFRQILSIAFSVLVFISSSSYSFGLHHCGGEVRDVAFLSEADGCGHQQLPPCHRKLMSGCCSDETLSYAGQGFDVNYNHVDISANTPVSQFIQPLLADEVIPALTSLEANFVYYDPPLRSSDHIIINQVFRI
jgi:hypothetical protein